MAIYRCAKCGFLAEENATPVGEKVACLRCGAPSAVYGTVFYVQKLIERYMAALQDVKALKLQIEQLEAEDQAPAEPVAATAPEPVAAQAPAPALAKPTPDIDLRNTGLLATEQQHAPLQTWFKSRQIEVQFDYAQVDTTGFFDDAAHMLGEGYALFAELIERIRFAYRKGHSTLHLELANVAQKDTQALNHLCRQLYSHTLFARYYYQKPEKIIRLTLQSTPTVRQFFEGAWLEWYVFVQTLALFQQDGRGFSCARGAKVVFPNEDLHELDVLFLPEGQQQPICVECKSGEFRREIDKYLRLRKRLGLDRSRFIICSTDLTEEQATGLSAMYELTFSSLGELPRRLRSLI